MTNIDHKSCHHRIEQLEDALRPFAKVANEYDADGLDECRPDWVKRGVAKFDPEQELYSGRGGNALITLGHVLEARAALLGTVIYVPELDPFVAQVIALYNASIPNLSWDAMSEERRSSIIENYRTVLQQKEKTT